MTRKGTSGARIDGKGLETTITDDLPSLGYCGRRYFGAGDGKIIDPKCIVSARARQSSCLVAGVRTGVDRVQCAASNGCSFDSLRERLLLAAAEILEAGKGVRRIGLFLAFRRQRIFLTWNITGAKLRNADAVYRDGRLGARSAFSRDVYASCETSTIWAS